MNTQTDKIAYEQAILSYLQDKYQETFEIKAMYQEFTGNAGVLIRATCVNKKYADEFSVRCYFDSSAAEKTLLIKEHQYSIEDSYMQILFQNQLMQVLPQLSDKHSVIMCRVEFYNRQPTADEYADGLEACLRNEKLRAYVKIYILSDGNGQAPEMYAKAEKLLQQYAPDTGYVYYVVLKSFLAEQVKQWYLEHLHNWGYFIMEQLQSEQRCFSVFKIETGLQSRNIVKG